MNSQSDDRHSEAGATSTFAQRFAFARDRQRALGKWQDDTKLALVVGISSAQITDYKARNDAPPAKRALSIAKAVGVDPGWLAFGEESRAPAPEGFATWLANQEKQPPLISGHIAPAKYKRVPKKGPGKRRRG